MANREMPPNLATRDYRALPDDPESAAMGFDLPTDMLPDELQVTALAAFQLLHGHLTPEGCKAATLFLREVVEGYEGQGRREDNEGEPFDVTGMSTVELQAELTRRGILGEE